VEFEATFRADEAAAILDVATPDFVSAVVDYIERQKKVPYGQDHDCPAIDLASVDSRSATGTLGIRGQMCTWPTGLSRMIALETSLSYL
jgi:hypothetical protein